MTSTRFFIPSLAASIALAASACNPATTPPDAGDPVDARADRASPPGDGGTIPGLDAGDPGADAGDPGSDAATPPDAGDPVDAGGPPDTTGCAAGEARCPTSAFNSEPRESYRCRPMVEGACPAPDLIVVRELMIDDTDGHVLDMSLQSFEPGSAEVMEGCVHGPGMRRLLRFNYAGANQGNENINVGRPDERDTTHWEYNATHMHFHVLGWADYRMRTLDGREVAYGHKQSFCLEDNIRLSDMSGPRQFPPPLCSTFDPTTPVEMRPEFGLSVGWGDEYPAGLRCQWVDLGPADPSAPDYVRDGVYSLAVTINSTRDGTHLYRESNYSNNTAQVRVEVRGDTARGCADTAGDACPGGRVQCDGACAP